jgi:hypothetical protein
LTYHSGLTIESTPSYDEDPASGGKEIALSLPAAAVLYGAFAITLRLDYRSTAAATISFLITKVIPPQHITQTDLDEQTKQTREQTIADGRTWQKENHAS